MMSLTIYNGSPKGKTSNSSLIINWFLNGYGHYDDTRYHYLNKIKQTENAINDFSDSDNILCVFPLYVDSMPGQVKNFFDMLAPLKNHCYNKSIVFIIHSGFYETIHSRILERYLNRMCSILGIKLKGVIIIPGSEGFKYMPDKMNKSKHMKVASLGKDFSSSRPFDPKALHWLQKTERFNFLQRFGFRFLTLIGLSNIYWNHKLKANNVYEKRYDAPYENGPTPVTTTAYFHN